MTKNRLSLVVAAALISTVAVVGCKKKEEAVVTPTPAPVETAPAPAPVAATASVTSLDLGNAVGADMKVTMPMTTFKPTDAIIAAVGTATSDAAATVPGKLSAKWTFQDGQTVNEESKDINFNGNGVTNFKISSPKGFPVGKYKVDISLDGAPVKSAEFTVAK